MPRKKQEIRVRILNPEVIKEWRKKESKIRANIIIEQIKSNLPPEEWSHAFDIAIGLCKRNIAEEADCLI